MRWRKGRRSSHIEDRRGVRVRRRAFKGGIGAIVIVLAVSYFLGIDPSVIFQMQQGAVTSTTASSRQPTAAEEQMADFVSVVLADTEDTWKTIFRDAGLYYQKPTLVLFTGQVSSACGQASAAMGPFYCLADEKVYIDLSFFDELKRRHGAPGDFAQAYVIAHEVGHHVQNLLGTSKQVRSEQHGLGKADANVLSVRLELQADCYAGNVLSVRLELQADCYAGLWAYHADQSRQVLEQGDLEEALAAASAIGDDRLQQETNGRVVPETFTHGTSSQRVKWFRLGFESGDFAVCDTFGS